MTEQVLKLEKAPGFVRKVSINVLNKDADFTLFTLPIENIELTFEQLDAFMGAYTHRSWYEQRGESWYPCAWFATRDNGSWELDRTLQCKRAILTIDGTDFAFEEYSADDEGSDDEGDEDMRPGGRITCIVLTPTAGGITNLSFHLQVRPELGKQSTALLAHQFRNVIVSFDDTTVAGKNAKQQSLPLVPQNTPEPPVVDQTGHQSPPLFVSRGGEAIDAEMRARHPEASEENMGTDPHPGPDPTNVLPSDGGMDPDLEADVKKFEDGARANLENFTKNATGGGAIDGTTTRSRRRRRGGGDDATH